ncbi:NADPH:quinone oxidoreductase family protein [Pseudonocardia pini]|uniref:NADPH:quinone oxidoreductase family protein n=1 Tax=Pseudonocardia pini TaxID=2758030 RepID=UPI0015F10968|nr:NADPH:quinone oxidoreductase family protein [Pseudonocardia pini]
MRAARVTRTDGPQSVEVGEVADATAGPGEVLIEVKAAGVNFPDLLLTQDKYQYKPELPFTLGGELAGVVREAPADSEFTAGDRVAASTSTGAFAELATAKIGSVFPLPDAVGFAAGACLPMNYLTMTFALITRGGLQEGETVLVQGAAGGIGTSTIQLAKALGARVISVVSSQEKADFVKSIGSDEAVLVDGFKDAVKELGGADLVVDPVGGDRFTDSLRCLNPLGRLLVIGFTAGDIPTVKVNRLLLNNIDVRGVGWGAYAMPREGYTRREWDTLVPFLESGVVDPPIGGTFPLDKVGEAVERLGERGVLGKFVIEP